MKRPLMLLVCIAVALSASACAAPKEPIRLSTTTSVNDSGLLPYLLPGFERESGYKVEVTSNGTGAAIKLGETGDADVLLVHAKASEEEFISKSFGVERIPFMYNYFVVVGPADDPAGVAGCANAADAFKAIYEKGVFVSRGDDSGTHKAELKIWDAAGIEPQGDNYISAGSGMGACITQANERQAYVLTDKATFLSMKDGVSLNILLEKSDEMKNTYSVIQVKGHDGLNTKGAEAFIKWITSEATLKKIEEYKKAEYGESLFFPGK